MYSTTAQEENSPCAEKFLICGVVFTAQVLVSSRALQLFSGKLHLLFLGELGIVPCLYFLNCLQTGCYEIKDSINIDSKL